MTTQPPHDRQAEESLIGSLLVDGSHVSLEVNPEDFFIRRYGTVWRAAQTITERGEPVDWVTINSEIERMGKVKEVDLAHLIAVMNNTPSSLHANHYAATIVDLAKRRKLLALASQLAKGAYNLDAPIDGSLTSVISSINGLKPSSQEDQIQRWSVAELLETDFPEPKWAIPDIVPEGLVLLGGRPKVGKSWLLLQMAWSVSTGGVFFEKKVEPGRVLFLAFEDNPRRLKSRIQKMGIPRDAEIEFQTDWRPLHKGGIDDLLIEMERGVYRMIGIDTLSRALPGIDYKKDEGIVNQVFNDLQRLSISRHQSVAIIDHTRKQTGFSPDPIDDIINLTVKTAMSDAVFALYREQGRPGAILRGRGRDFEDINFQLFWDASTACWQYEGEAEEVAKDTLKGKIIQAIRELEIMGETPTNERISNHLGANKGNVSRAIGEMIADGLIARGKKHGREVPYHVL